MTTTDEVKELLSEPKFRIKLYDYVQDKASSAISSTAGEDFSLNVPLTPEAITSRLRRYEEVTSDLISAMTLIGFWGSSDHLKSATLPFKKFSAQFPPTLSGGWVSLQSYPLIILMYSLGIGAIAANNYDLLYGFFQSPMNTPSQGSGEDPLILAIRPQIQSVIELLKKLPDRQKQRTPLSEYLFEFFKGRIINTIPLEGNEYEAVFDRFELFFVLQLAHESQRNRQNHISGPFGRFAWKYGGGAIESAFGQLRSEALRANSSWPPLKSGFFGGLSKRFIEITELYELALQNLHW